VIAAVEKSPSVRAVVLTGSLSAVYGDNWEKGPDHTYTEADWNTTANEGFLPYGLSKTLSERRAWELHDAQPVGPDGKRRWRLVSLLPAFVLGRPATRGTSELVDFAANLMAGKFWPAMPNVQFPYVHLEDVAAAHVLAALTETADGRIILSHGMRTGGLLDVVKSLQPRFPAYRFPTMELPKWILWIVCHVTGLFPWDLAKAGVGKPVGVNGTRAQQVLGLQYHDPVDGLAELLHGVVELGLAPKRELKK